MNQTPHKLFHVLVVLGASLTGATGLPGCGVNDLASRDAAADQDYGRISPPRCPDGTSDCYARIQPSGCAANDPTCYGRISPECEGGGTPPCALPDAGASDAAADADASDAKADG
jgi:hypothetical protein